MGKRIRGPKPQLRDWTLLFLKKDGRDNRNKIAKEFAEFWDDIDQDVITITGNCYLAGHVFGINNTKNGSRYVTDRIISVERKLKKSMIVSDIYVRTCNSGGYDLHLSSDYAEKLGTKRVRYYNAVGSRKISFDEITQMLKKAADKAGSLTLECTGAVRAKAGDIVIPEGETDRFYVREICITAGENGIRTKITAGVKMNVA